MANMDRLMLWGACAAMAAVGSLSVWKISRTPRIDPVITRLDGELTRKAQDRIVYDPPPRIPAVRNPFIETIKEPAPANHVDPFLKTRLVGEPKNRPVETVLVLPFPVVGEAKADLDGATVRWTLEERPVALKSWMKRQEAKPTGFIIQRQCEDGQVEEVGRVGPQERSFTDLSTEPRLTYRYWVLAIGEESTLTMDPPVTRAVAKGLNLSAEARTPTATRVRLVGGDKDYAVLRVETYDRAQKKWIGRLAPAVPGKVVGTSGWTLRSLRFDNFTLVADLTDDEGVERVLTTKD